MAIVLDGSLGIDLPGNSSDYQSGSLTLGTAKSASGTSVDFTDIPNWVKRITVMFYEIGSNGTSFPLIQLGTGGVATTSGYSTLSGALTGSATGVSTSTAGFIFRTAASASTNFNGHAIFTKMSGNIWIGSGIIMDTVDNRQVWSAGNVSLSSTLDMIRITTVGGTNLYDAGSINILYE